MQGDRGPVTRLSPLLPFQTASNEHRSYGRPYKAFALFHKQNGLCFYCGCEMLLHINHRRKPQFMTIDHKLPKVRGGTREDWNCVGACLSCNTRKGDMRADEYIAMLKDKAEMAAEVETLLAV